MSFILAFISALLLTISSLLSGSKGFISPLPKNGKIVKLQRVSTPSAKLQILTATESAVLDLPTPPPTTENVQPPPDPKIPWGTTEKIAEHLYRTYVGSDEKMGTPEEILTALNFYRKNHNSPGNLRMDENLCKLARERADAQEKEKTLDSHKGLIEYMEDSEHWRNLDIKSIGENASYGYILNGTHLIEWVFDADEEHRSNQLNPEWNLACAGISGSTVDILFGKR